MFLIVGFLLGSIPFLTMSFAEDESLIPSWVKNTAKFWVEGGVSDREFLNALQFLISEGILEVSDPSKQQIESTNSPENTERLGVITCDKFGTKSVKMDIWIVNSLEQTIDVELVAMGLDENGQTVSLNVFTVYDVLPGQKKYDTTYIDDHPDLVSCSLDAQEVRYSR